MKARVITIVILICVSIFICFPFLLLLNKETAYYAYKEITYKTIADSLATGTKDAQNAAVILCKYFHQGLFTPNGAHAVDKDTYNDLIRGIAYCDQRVWGMSAFLAKRGIDSRMLMTVNPEGQSNHTVLEAMIGGKWRLFDPLYGLYIFKKDGEIASYLEICEDPGLLFESPRMLILRDIDPGSYDIVRKNLGRNVYYRNAKAPVIWNGPAKSKGPVKSLLAKVLDLYVTLFGRRYSDIFQDAYLRLFAEKSGYNELYFKARNYDIYRRYKLAADHYRRYIDGSPPNLNLDDAKLFLGILYTKTGEGGKAIRVLEGLIAASPPTGWDPAAYYYMGYNYEAGGEIEKAKDCYLKSMEIMKRTKDESDITRVIELDSFERLRGLK